jgi:hypothetical protein
MPARNISSQSFDHILSDLGDDPAIPDPHGIRKTPSPKNIDFQAPNDGKSRGVHETIARLDSFTQTKKLTLFLGLVAFLGVLLFGGLIAYGAISNHAGDSLQESQHQISLLQKELTALRKDFDEDMGALYEEIDILEVSIHSLKQVKPNIQAKLKPVSLPYEQEIRRWRYLGTSQMGGIQQALFDLGNSHEMFSKGVLVLGEWRLSEVEKDAVTIGHPTGKSIVLKPVKNE